MASYLSVLAECKGDAVKAREICFKIAGLDKYDNLPGKPDAILAKDAEVDTDYLVDGLFYKVTIKRINRMGDSDDCSSVSIRSEEEPENMSAVISGSTPLIPYSEQFHFYEKRKKASKKKETTPKINTPKAERVKKEKVVKEKTASLSSFVDPFVFQMSLTEKSDFKEVAGRIMESGLLAPTTSLKQVLSLVHIRYWHFKNGKIGPNVVKKEKK
jgi:hypothetical protein